MLAFFSFEIYTDAVLATNFLVPFRSVKIDQTLISQKMWSIFKSHFLLQIEIAYKSYTSRFYELFIIHIYVI